MHAAEVCWLAAAGFAGGFVNAIAGGGSLLVFPALVATGMGAVTANITNSVALWPGYIGNLVGLGPEAARELRRQRELTVICILATSVGTAILLTTPGGAFDLIVPVLVLLATTLIGFQPWIAARVGAESTPRPRTLQIAVAVASLYGGYFGGGLGVILLATLGLTMVAPLREINRIKSVLQFLVSTVSLLAFVIFGHVRWLAVLTIAPAALLGGVVGGRATRVVSEKVLRIVVVVFGAVIGGWLGIRAYT